MRDLRSTFVQLDELVAKLRGSLERAFVWVAVDANTKLIPEIHVGRRRAEDAYAIVHRLTARLAPGHVPAFASDGLRAYFSAITAHFGAWHHLPGRRKPVWVLDPRLLFGMLHKLRSGMRLKAMYTKMRVGTRAAWITRMHSLGLTGTVQTAFIERLNLTLRESIAPLSRRTLRQAQGRPWSLAASTAVLLEHLEWHRAYYHFVLPHSSLGTYRKRITPAMAARLTRHRWTVLQLLNLPILHQLNPCTCIR